MRKDCFDGIVRSFVIVNIVQLVKEKLNEIKQKYKFVEMICFSSFRISQLFPFAGMYTYK